MSKTQVAPLKAMSVPRLELQACLMAARLAEFIKKQMHFAHIKTFLWSDSVVALLWIKMESRSLKEFVSNRVSSIQKLTESCQWRHVANKVNPADSASRGVNLQELIKPGNRWFNGPPFLKTREKEWPKGDDNPDKKPIEVKAEKREIKLHFYMNSTASKNIFLKVENFSTIESLRKKVAFVRRPFCNWRVKQDSRSPMRPTTRSSIKKKQVLKEEPIDPLTPEELQQAEI